MCDSPTRIPNPNNFKEMDIKARLAQSFPWKDYTSSHINVPCGHCASCTRAKQDGIVQRVQMESQKNHFFMCTISYSPEMLPKVDVNGYKIPYFDVTDLQKAIKMMRKENAFGIPFRHLWVSELGSKRGRPHAHILFVFRKEDFPKEKDDYIAACDAFASKSQHYFTMFKYWRRNVGTNRNPVWRPCSRYVEKWQNGQLRKTYDFHYVNPFITKNGVEDCGMYVLKYMFKPSSRAVRLQQALRMNLHENDFWPIWRKIRSRYSASIGFGYNAWDVDLRRRKYEKDNTIVETLRESIAVSKQEQLYPAVFHPYDGRAHLLSSYYMRNTDIYSFADRKYFWDKQHNLNNAVEGDIHMTKDTSLTEMYMNHERIKKTAKHCDELGIDSDFRILYDEFSQEQETLDDIFNASAPINPPRPPEKEFNNIVNDFYDDLPNL